MSLFFKNLCLFTALLSAGLAGGAWAENTDSKDAYVWGENIGWINARAGGSGMQVDASDLTGYLWAENVGWINLNCKNNNSCGTVAFGVKNDGNGILSGFAWGENIGWVNFRPISGGVQIDPKTGIFNGHAWGENIGWVSFAASGPGAFQLKTSWTQAAGSNGPNGPGSGTNGQGGNGGNDSGLEGEEFKGDNFFSGWDCRITPGDHAPALSWGGFIWLLTPAVLILRKGLSRRA